MDSQSGQSTRFTTASDYELSVGDILDGRYQLDKIIGRGGCGLVFRATDLNLQRDVAVKVLTSDAMADDGAIQKFNNESQILRRLHAQNTVFFYDCGQTEHHQPYFVMEFVSGIQLKDVLEKEGMLPPKRVVAILVQVLSALEEAHEYGFVHRDLKPGNIMLCQRPGFPDDFVKVLDFGIAKIMSKGDSHEKAEMAGTPKYMPPEQFKNEPLTPLADLYSLGCIAYEMLTGIAPFDGETLHVTVAKHLLMTPKSFPREIEQYPNLVATVFKLLEKQPAGRFENARKAIEALEHWNERDLIPSLQGCRIKGDDNQDSSFFEDETSDSPSLEVPVSDLLAHAQDEPNHAAQHAPVHPSMQARALPLRSHGTRPLALTMIVIGTAVALMLGAVLLVTDPLNLFGVEEEILPPAAETAEQVSKIDPITVDTLMIAHADSALDGVTFGIASLDHLDDIFDDLQKPLEEKSEGFDFGLDAPEMPKGSEKSDRRSGRKKNKASEGSERKEEAEPKGEEAGLKGEEAGLKGNVASGSGGKYQIFEFTFRYSPADARVGFLNAQGKCSDKGLCEVRTTSETAPVKIVLSAEGYQTKILTVTRKTSEIQMSLVPQQNSD